jgi:hypothetical protein
VSLQGFLHRQNLLSFSNLNKWLNNPVAAQTIKWSALVEITEVMIFPFHKIFLPRFPEAHRAVSLTRFGA